MPPLREKKTNLIIRKIPYEKPSRLDIKTLTDGTKTASSLEHVAQPVSNAEPPPIVSANPMQLIQVHGQDFFVINFDEDEDEDEDDDEEIHYKWNCNQIRNKINKFIRSGEMKVTHFQKEIRINSNSYGRFMKLKGPLGGCDNQTYHAAHKFFLLREKASIKVKKPKKETTASIDKFNVDGIVLEGESDGKVPVYDTCDDVRKKIEAHLREPGITQAGFCREIAKTYRHFVESEKKIQSVQLKTFLGQKGPRSGNLSAVYYAAYVFFEKLRIKTGAKKTKKRLEVEAEHWDGMDRTTNYANQRYIVSAGSGAPQMDYLGRVFGGFGY